MTATIPRLSQALAAVAPVAAFTLWVPALTPPMLSSGISTPRRVAAFLGQCAIESAGFQVLAENMNYTHADRILAIFPNEVKSLEDARALVGNPEALANRVYANRLGNGDKASGDGWTFRGSGLLQLTGRNEIGVFAGAIGKTPAETADYLRTPVGAAAGACWYWGGLGLNYAADAWDLDRITRAINGAAMLQADARRAASEAAMAALEV